MRSRPASDPDNRLWDAELPSRSEIHYRPWPEVATESLIMLGDEAAVRAANQRSLAVSVLWQAITESIGFPDAPPATLAPAAIEKIPGARP